MEESMRSRLEALKKRYEEIESLLADEKIEEG